MAFGRRIQCWFLVLVLLCLVGCMGAINRATRPALLFDTHLQDANRKVTSIQAAGIVEFESVLTEVRRAGLEAGRIEEGRILLAEGNELTGNTLDYSPSGPNHDHDPKHPHGNVNIGTKTTN